MVDRNVTRMDGEKKERRGNGGKKKKVGGRGTRSTKGWWGAVGASGLIGTTSEARTWWANDSSPISYVMTCPTLIGPCRESLHPLHLHFCLVCISSAHGLSAKYVTLDWRSIEIKLYPP